MKNILLTATFLCTLVLTGCFESTQEITLNEDGSGNISSTNDMSALIGLARQMGGGEEIEKAATQKIDSTFSLASQADSIANLSPEEKAMVRKGVANIMMNLKEEKFTTNIKFPFATAAELLSCNRLSAKIMAQTIKGQMGGMPMDSGAEMPEFSSFDDYYTVNFSNGVIAKTLNKEKYAKAGDDEYLKGVKEAAGMGLSMKANYIINLPRPAKKAEGAGVTLSADRKRVTISVGIDDFFDEPSKLEFRIEY